MNIRHAQDETGMYYRKNLSDCLIPARIISFGLAGALMVNLSGMAWAQAPASAPAADTAGDYQLGSADRVRVIVFNEPSLSGNLWSMPMARCPCR
jgi:polysaccharide export outer membrane protein